MTGDLTVIVGPMFSGKTTRLLAILDAALAGDESVLALKPVIDNRYRVDELVAHSGESRHARSLSSATELEHLAMGLRTLVIDEAQFLPTESVDLVRGLADQGTSITVGALDFDFRGVPFPSTLALINVATSVERLVGVCSLCGADATRSQRLIDGRPAPLTGPSVLIGGPESYQPRCEPCFLRERMMDAT